MVLAEGVGGTLENFVAMMNQQAQAWGLKNTQFKNVTGLTEPGHHSTARDLAVIAAQIIQRLPGVLPATTRSASSPTTSIKQDNRNLLLRRDPTVDGMKTGYTDAAGYCLVASAGATCPTASAACSAWCWARPRARRAPARARSC